MSIGYGYASKQRTAKDKTPFGRIAQNNTHYSLLYVSKWKKTLTDKPW